MGGFLLLVLIVLFGILLFLAKSILAAAVAGVAILLIIKSALTYIKAVVSFVTGCTPATAILGIISVLLISIGLLLLAPAFVAIGGLAAAIYSIFTGSVITLTTLSWISSCK